MKRFVKSIFAVLAAIAGLVLGTVWAVKTDWDLEPILVLVVSFLEVLGFIFLKSVEDEDKAISRDSLPISEYQLLEDSYIQNDFDRNAVIELMKEKTRILFIDDDKNFNVVRLLKDSGWKHTKSLVDVKGIDTSNVKEIDIFFVDINGVGKLLKLQYEGLDLALMLKQKYPDKKVVIYSANKNSNAFHKAWDECDFKLEKNALPYQFQSLVEQYSIEKYQSEL